MQVRILLFTAMPYYSIGSVKKLMISSGGQLDPAWISGESKQSEREMWNQSWNLNVTSPWLVTKAFMPLLLESKVRRVLFITSGTSTLTDAENQSLAVNKPSEAGWPKPAKPPGSEVPAYRSSKTGMNMMVRELFRILKNDGVKCLLVSPGWLATALGATTKEAKLKVGAIEPEKGGQFVATVIQGDRDADEGKVVLAGGKIQPW